MTTTKQRQQFRITVNTVNGESFSHEGIVFDFSSGPESFHLFDTNPETLRAKSKANIPWKDIVSVNIEPITNVIITHQETKTESS